MLLLGSTRYRATLCQTLEGKKMSTTALPFELDLIVRKRIDEADLAWARAALGTLPNEKNFKAIIGDCDGIRKAVTLASRVAIRNVNVLLLGESGVGKELFAEAIHKESGRKGKFIAINCAAIPSELFEPELFGTIKGSGTGIAARDGYFKEADEGSLFLDEVGELLPQHQSKLLRAIQSADPTQSPTKLKLQTVGTSGKHYEVDVRIIAATNRNLLKLTQSSFRNDLYYRLATFPILIPPLRERGSDIVSLAKHLLTRINEQFSTTEPGYTAKFFGSSEKFVPRVM
jgi:transcriptional regulator with PAS, ATPase and Fis domain